MINLAFGDLPKQAVSFVLPVALEVLAGSGQSSIERLEQYAVVGELALEVTARPIKGVLSMAIEAAKNANLHGLVVPRANASEAAVVEEIEVIAVGGLAQCVAFFAGGVDLSPTPSCIADFDDRFSAYVINLKTNSPSRLQSHNLHKG